MRRLIANPIKNVTAVIANPRAVKAKRRFTSVDLNRSFGDGDAWENRRAAWLLELSKQFDVVLDFHNTYCPDNNCGFVGSTASESLYDIAGVVGLNKIIVADYDCINKYAPNCLSVEVSITSKQNELAVWYERIGELARMKTPKTPIAIQKYRFVYRMTLEDRDIYNLQNENLVAFKPLSRSIAQQLGLTKAVYPIFIGDAFTPYNYGGLVERLK